MRGLSDTKRRIVQSSVRGMYEIQIIIVNITPAPVLLSAIVHIKRFKELSQNFAKRDELNSYVGMLLKLGSDHIVNGLGNQSLLGQDQSAVSVAAKDLVALLIIKICILIIATKQISFAVGCAVIAITP